MIVQRTGQFNQYRAFLDNLAECWCVDRRLVRGELRIRAKSGLAVIRVGGEGWARSGPCSWHTPQKRLLQTQGTLQGFITLHKTSLRSSFFLCLFFMASS